MMRRIGPSSPLTRATRRGLVRRRRARRRGMAIILVLGALTLLTILLTEIQDESSADLAGALQARDALVAEYAARSAVNLSRLLIASEPTLRKGLGFMALMFGGAIPQIPVWQLGDTVLAPFNNPAAAESFQSFSGLDLTRGQNLGLPGATFDLKIVDEDSKINVNAAANPFVQIRLSNMLMALMAGPQYDPLFERRDRDGNFSDRRAICAALCDWVDSADATTALCDPTSQTNQQMPAEDSYYERLDRPYQRRNAPFDSLEEMRRVRGMGDDFWSTFIDPDPDDPSKRRVTVWGSADKININTAPPASLLVLICYMASVSNAAVIPKVCSDLTEAQKFLTMVGFAKSMMAGIPAFGSPGVFAAALQGNAQEPLKSLIMMLGLEPIPLDPGLLKQLVTTESKVFSVYVTGVVKSGKRETRVKVHAVVDFRAAPPPGMPTVPPQLAAA
ncbi:MAG TPA: type II secretion system protein GspK, partial [Polyangiaceae bacterium]|nr:type II secretion system protein GspK [Polyangiaceae bacterium]